MIKVNGYTITPTIFPDGTSQIWKINDEILASHTAQVFWDFQGESEFIHLAQLKALLSKKCINVYLHISYLPYGRQDKEITNQTTFALQTFARLLNSLDFTEIYCTDPHSDVAEMLIKNFYPIYPRDQIEEAIRETKATMLCYPDAGALRKYTKFLKGFAYIFGKKYRDQQSGIISEYSLEGDCRRESVMIVDDICDGGATFITLANALYEAGAADVCMFVSHGIFSKGTDVLKQAGINRIFTTKGEVK